MVKTTGIGTARLRRKTEVPGQALGIGLQYTRLVQLLLQALPGSAAAWSTWTTSLKKTHRA